MREEVPPSMYENITGAGFEMFENDVASIAWNVPVFGTERGVSNMAAMLIPDSSIAQSNDTFIWCCPATDYEWNKLVGLSMQFKCVTPGGLQYLHRIGKGRKRLIIVMWNPPEVECPWKGDPVRALSQADVEQECAWLRLVKDWQQPIYVLPHGKPLTMMQIIERAMGSAPHLVQSTDSMTEVNEDGNP